MDTLERAVLHPIDIGLLVVYALSMIGFGVWSARRSHDAEDYFLAGRRMVWPVIGFSLFASNISSTTIVGLAGSAYGSGIWVFNYEWMAALVLAFFALFVLPQVLRSQVYTMPEFLERRFGRAARLYFAGLTLFLNVVVDTAATLYAGALLVQLVFPNAEVWQTVTVLALIAGGYTILGGLSAVMITDVIQAVLLLIGACVISTIAFAEVGGWGAVMDAVDPKKLSLVRPADDPDMPWPALITGVPLLGFYFWGTNQFMAQRFLSAKDANHARWGALLAGFLKLPVLFIMVLPGTFAILLYPSLPRADLVYPTLMFDLLPVGLLGLVLAGFFAALMSLIDSTLNSASTMVTMDFVRTARPTLSDAALMQIGRLVTFLFMLFAVIWAPQIGRFESIFEYIQQVLSYTVGPVVALYLVGTFWPRANRQGANAALVIGTLTGLGLFAGQVVAPGLGSGPMIAWAGWHWLYVAPAVALVSALVMLAVSLATPAPDRSQTDAYVWTPRLFREETAELRVLPWWQNYRFQFLALLALSALLVGAFW
ncbi:sodium:solute symporter [Parvularcula dongshanensis]|uniref:SSS family solute:Na+ symporter n=1 Tax=Parvularcula dongshanensis TaxID=1173995 RepID=A0A840I5N8_9PROT|nr:sodium:solute symporter [Parvularcula dongshanensis]MBB4660179.1 SSS family solute:Na+ symporter [Parvularcula dongshanensis]